MQKSLIASVIALSLSACDSDVVMMTADGIVTDNGTVVTTEAADSVVGVTDTPVGDSSATTDTGSTTNTSGTTGTTDSSSGTNASDDKDDAGTFGGNVDDGKGDTGISDDAGSSSSDGGVSDDAGSSSSDGGVSDDAGSSSSDGGVTDDSGSSSSDGGVTDDSGSSSSDGGQNPVTPPNTDGGSFQSSQVGGTIIRQSTLSSSAQENICTTIDAPNDFSYTTVGDFILHNNAWRTWRVTPGTQWQQCIYTNTNGALAGWNYDWGSAPSSDFYVRSYPELIYGVKDEYRTSAPKSVTGLPVRLGNMPNITIDYSYAGPEYGQSRPVDASNNPRFPNGTTISGERNVAIESFFYNADANGQCSEGIVRRDGGTNHVYEVMVWLDAGAERLPAGPNDFVADVSIRGDAYKIYTKGADPRYIAFVAQNPQTTGTLYWNDFTDWARTYAHRVQQDFGARSNSVQIQDDWCVANIIVGTEIFWGAGNLDIYDWTITQRQP